MRVSATLPFRPAWFQPDRPHGRAISIFLPCRKSASVSAINLATDRNGSHFTNGPPKWRAISFNRLSLRLGSMAWHKRQEILKLARSRARDLFDGDGAHVETWMNRLAQVSLQARLICFCVMNGDIPNFQCIVVGLNHLHLPERNVVTEASDLDVRIDNAAILQCESIAIAAKHARQRWQPYGTFDFGGPRDGVVADLVANEWHRIIIKRCDNDAARLARRAVGIIVAQDFDPHRLRADMIVAADDAFAGNETNLLRTVLIDRGRTENVAADL